MAQNITELLVSIGSKFDPRGMRSASQAIAEQQRQLKTLQDEKRKGGAADRLASLQELVEQRQKQVMLRGSASDIRASISAQRDLKIAQVESAVAGQMGMDKSLAGVTALTSAVGVGLVGAFALAAAGAAAFGTQFQGAMKTELDRLSDINAYKRATGETLAQSQTATNQIRKAAAIAGRDLPVEAVNIQRAQSSVIDDLAKYSKGADLQKSLLNIGTGSALAAQSAQIDVSNANLLNNKILAGASLGGLNQIALYERESGVRTALEAAYQKRGITTSAQIGGAERAKLLEEVYTAAFPKDAIDRMRGTAQAKISEFTDNLFDPEIGMFSFSRALKDGRSVFDSAKVTLDLLIGKDGIFGQISRLLGFSAGGSGDPLEDLQGAIDGFNKYLEGIVKTLTNLKKLGGSEIGGMVGRLSADITDALVTGLVGAIAGIDWGQVAIGVVVGIGSFFANLDWSTYLLGALALVGAAVVPGVLSAIGTFIAGVVGTIVAVVGGVPLLIGAAIVLAVVGVVKLITDNWQAISGFVSGAFDRAKQGAALFGQFLNDGWSALISLVTEAGTTIATNVSGFFNAVTSWVDSLWKSIPAPVRSALGVVASTTPVGAAVALGGVIANRAAGQIPNAAAGFPVGVMEAIGREMAAAPSGSSPIIANSSEFIIPRAKAAGVLTAAGRGDRNVTVSVGNIIVQGASNARETAEAVKIMLLNEINVEIEAMA